jgi:hypothetical protein
VVINIGLAVQGVPNKGLHCMYSFFSARRLARPDPLADRARASAPRQPDRFCARPPVCPPARVQT